MAFTDVLSGAAKNFTGNLDTAYLVVDDYREMAAQMVNASVNSLGSGALSQLQSTLNEAAAAMDSVRSAASQALASGASAASVPQFKKPKYFKVQFNPSEIQLDSALPYVPEQKQDVQPGGQGSAGVTDSALRPNVTLSVNLYFDQFNKADAFRSTVLNMNMNAADLATNAATGIAKLTGKVWSVQPQVEAILAALYNRFTRYVTFCWTDFSFTGTLSNVGAQYTMFSTSGNPIRATVALRIQQELDPAAISSWSSSLRKAFGGSSAASSVLGSVSSMLNLHL